MTVGVRRLGHVSSEGGPLLLLDVSILPSWGGADVGDYHRICDWLDRHPDQPGYAAEVGPSEGLVWDVRVGTADVFRVSSTRVVLSQPWLRDDARAGEAVSVPPHAARPFGSLPIRSGGLLAFWSPGRGSEIQLGGSIGDGDAVQVAGIDGAGIVVTLPAGTYTAWHDDVDTASVRARRCWLVPEGEQPA
jgi:hypothetical protein